ncbi:CDP-alcohol phosphatidyltransferase-domain-containing protein [Phycomyces blakesleeanus]|uniref:CDP-alcohol phosphatidyltransferase-domain-containing protein n=1 Tax=Phycomyces blakesleeanus TaxID=4837 RepID=A0ABR3B287_PHYBL
MCITMNISPNLITLLGLFCTIFNVLTLFYYDTSIGPCPNWVYTSFGIGLFVYQSLDAIDGKQARRTGASGPLGELFDHSCDALNTMLGVFTWASATGLGQSWWTVCSLFAGLCNFYLSTWEEYHTGVLYLGYFSGPVEGVLMLVAVHLWTGIAGPDFWKQNLNQVVDIDWLYSPYTHAIGKLPLNHLLIIVGAVVVVFNISSALLNVIKVKIYPTDTSHKDRSILKAVAGLLPFVLMTGLSVGWLYMWPSLVYEDLSTFILFTGLLFGHQVGTIITSHVAKLSFPFWDTPAMALLCTGCALAYVETSLECCSVAIDHRLVIRAFLVLAGAQYFIFIIGIIQQICTYLDIGCLYIKKKKTLHTE